MPAYQKILYAVDPPVARITLNRPEKRNALDEQIVAEIKAALREAANDSNARVVLLAGAGKDFCSGADLAALQRLSEATVIENLADARHLADLFIEMRRHPRPVVAAVRGRALAGGCGLATACDLVLAAESAQFGYPEVQRGFVPAIVMTLLKRTAGEKVAFDLAATGRILGATEAAGLGLVSRVYEDSDFDDQAGEVLRALAAASPSALALTKQQFYQLDGMPFEEGVRLGADVDAVSRTTPDFPAALKAFLKK